MGLTSLQVCMDTSDWFQGAAHEERASGSTSPPSGEMMTCSKVPLVERRLRPPHEQVLKCPRCDSTHTKFCYYNNYSLSQPRYFCKTCRRYWTKGGTLRNVPVGGGCRKNNKKVSASTSNKKPMINQQHPPSHLFPSSSSFSSLASTDLHLSFSGGLPFSHLNYSFLENTDGVLDNQCKYGDTMLGNLDGDTHVTDSKLDLMMAGSSAGYYSSVNIGDGFGAQTSLGYNVISSELHGPCCTPFGFTMDYGNVGDHHGHGSFSNGAGLGERLLLPFGGGEDPNAVEVKPSNSVLALESHGHHQACSDQVGKDSSMGGGYPVSGGIGAWSGVLNRGYVSSTTANQLM